MANTFSNTRFYRNLVHFACSRAYTSDVIKGRHCAIILDENKNIISIFVNCFTCDGKSTVHAEAGAIQALKSTGVQINKNHIMLVVRITIPGNITFSKPCFNCERKIKESGISTCIYTTNVHNVLEVLNFN